MLLALRSLWEGPAGSAPVFVVPEFQCADPCIVCPPSGILGAANDPNNPFLNLSSERPDMDVFLGRGYTDNKPPLGQLFYSMGCVSFCVGNTQQEADDCAAQQNIICTGNNWPIYNPPPTGSPPGTPGTFTPRPIFYNTEQTCTRTCESGTVASYTVSAGTVWAFSQAAANAQAYSRACNQVNQNTICMSDLSQNRICYLTSNTVTLSATNVYIYTIFAVVAGDLPGGMNLQQNTLGGAIITGTPTVSGLFAFTIGVVDGTGEYAETSYTLEVFGIINSSPLTTATTNVAYVETMVLGGTPVGNWDFALTSGTLPTGLTLNTVTGVISGTPTVAGTYAFTIQVEDNF